MNATTSLANYSAIKRDPERGHRLRVYAAWALSIALVLALSIYGANYYLLGTLDRPFSPKHALLKPSGSIGIKLGILGVCLFLVIFLYPLRKRIPWLGRIGTTRHWLDFHILLGITAPVVIAFHSSFKFSGIAGMAFWIMVAVAVSGFIGRYHLCADSPQPEHRRAFAERVSESAERLTQNFEHRAYCPSETWQPLLRCRTPGRSARNAALPRPCLTMLALDLSRAAPGGAPAHARAGSGRSAVLSLGAVAGHRASRTREYIIQSARRKSSLAKRVAFLSRSQQVFHLWHVDSPAVQLYLRGRWHCFTSRWSPFWVFL